MFVEHISKFLENTLDKQKSKAEINEYDLLFYLKK